MSPATEAPAGGERRHRSRGHPPVISSSSTRTTRIASGAGDSCRDAMKSACRRWPRSASKLWSRRAAVGPPAAADAAVAAAVAADAPRSASASRENPAGAAALHRVRPAGVPACSGSMSARKSTACSVCVRSMVRRARALRSNTETRLDSCKRMTCWRETRRQAAAAPGCVAARGEHHRQVIGVGAAREQPSAAPPLPRRPATRRAAGFARAPPRTPARATPDAEAPGGARGTSGTRGLRRAPARRSHRPAPSAPARQRRHELGTTAASSSGLSAAHRSDRARARVHAAGEAKGGVRTATTTLLFPAAAAGGGFSERVAVRGGAHDGWDQAPARDVPARGRDASAGPARRSAVAAINVPRIQEKRPSDRASIRLRPKLEAPPAPNTRKPPFRGRQTVAQPGGACRVRTPPRTVRARPRS